MPSNEPSHTLPRSNDGLAILHGDVANSLCIGTIRVMEALAQSYGEEATQAAVKAILSETGNLAGATAAQHFDKVGWRQYIDEEADHTIDFIEATGMWRSGAEYAAQGIAPNVPPTKDIVEREKSVRTLVAFGEDALHRAALLFGDDLLRIWNGVAARAALDFGGRLSIDGIHALASISEQAVRNAAASGDLVVDADGLISVENARDWLARRRDFFPSRWRDPSDDQWPFDPGAVDQESMVRVPQDRDGVAFMPDHVARSARRGKGISITIGAKGSETQEGDFYEALKRLAREDVPRWRRRNSVGNWGIVRARGPWIAVPRQEVERQLAAKIAEGG